MLTNYEYVFIVFAVFTHFFAPNVVIEYILVFT